MTDVQGQPEPNGWELLRAVNGLRDSVANLAAGMVTQATLAVWQAAQKERDDRQDARLREIESDIAEARKTKAQQWFAISLAVVGMIGTLVISLVRDGLQP